MSTNEDPRSLSAPGLLAVPGFFDSVIESYDSRPRPPPLYNDLAVSASRPTSQISSPTEAQNFGSTGEHLWTADWYSMQRQGVMWGNECGDSNSEFHTPLGSPVSKTTQQSPRLSAAAMDPYGVHGMNPHFYTSPEAVYGFGLMPYPHYPYPYPFPSYPCPPPYADPYAPFFSPLDDALYPTASKDATSRVPSKTSGASSKGFVPVSGTDMVTPEDAAVSAKRFRRTSSIALAQIKRRYSEVNPCGTEVVSFLSELDTIDMTQLMAETPGASSVTDHEKWQRVVVENLVRERFGVGTDQKSLTPRDETPSGEKNPKKGVYQRSFSGVSSSSRMERKQLNRASSANMSQDRGNWNLSRGYGEMQQRWIQQQNLDNSMSSNQQQNLENSMSSSGQSVPTFGRSAAGGSLQTGEWVGFPVYHPYPSDVTLGVTPKTIGKLNQSILEAGPPGLENLDEGEKNNNPNKSAELVDLRDKKIIKSTVDEARVQLLLDGMVEQSDWKMAVNVLEIDEHTPVEELEKQLVFFDAPLEASLISSGGRVSKRKKKKRKQATTSSTEQPQSEKNSEEGGEEAESSENIVTLGTKKVAENSYRKKLPASVEEEPYSSSEERVETLSAEKKWLAKRSSSAKPVAGHQNLVSFYAGSNTKNVQ